MTIPDSPLKIKGLFAGLVVSVIFVLTACGSSGGVSSDKNSGANEITLHLVSTARTNLDTKGQATPVSVTLYQLRATDNFQNSDYFTLSAGNDVVLASDIAKTSHFILRPADQRTVVVKPEQEVVAFGIVAAYREIDHASWQQIYMIKTEDDRPWYQKMLTKNPTVVDVRFEQSAISIKEVN